MRSHASTLPPATPWQQHYADAITDPRELLRLLKLPTTLLNGTDAATVEFSLRVPRGYIARMEPGNPDDPLLRQVLPRACETDGPQPGFGVDPVGDLSAMSRPGVLQKYQGRALLIATGACAINCRYCFRRHFPYAEANAAAGEWNAAITALRNSPDIREVILSGGDPLVLSDRRLRRLVGELQLLPHVRTLRIHTRLPIVLPERVDDALLHWLAQTPLRRVMVLHANHPAEIDGAVHAACTRLSAAGVTLLNQAVLLRGVNDDEDCLVDLSERLLDVGVLPYYLHALDAVRGAAHFAVSDDRARQLAQRLRRRLPGYLVPRLVREIPGMPYKAPL